MNGGTAALILILANGIVSYLGLTNRTFFEGYKFEVDAILVRKDYKRLVSSGFLHVSWAHLILNMVSLYMFSGLLEYKLGSLLFLFIYFAGLIGGDLLALFIHRNHGDYSAVGASGAVCGIIFAAIALYPHLGVGFFGLPFSIPSWLYGTGYILFTIYGIQSKRGNIGHDAHLGGALTGMLLAILFQPEVIRTNYLPIILVLVPSLLFIYLVVTRPHLLVVDSYFSGKRKNYRNIDEKYNEERVRRQQDLDALLDKISRQGMNSLTRKEKQRLEAYSKQQARQEKR